MAGPTHQMRMFDLGGQFISKSQEHLMTLLAKLDINIVEKEASSSNKVIGELGYRRTETCKGDTFNLVHSIHKYALNLFLEKLDFISEQVSLSDQASILKYIEYDSIILDRYIEDHLEDTVAKNLLRNIVKTSCGVDASQMSLLFFVIRNSNTNEGFVSEHIIKTWIDKGAQHLCETLSKRIGETFIKKDHPVFDIIRNKDHVIVETDTKKYKCRYVVVTASPKDILNINFSPPLSRSRKYVLEQVIPGHGVKFIATYKKAFWRDSGYTGDIVACGKLFSKGPIHLCADVSLKNSPALMGIIGLPDCLDISEEDSHGLEYQFKDDVLQHLAYHFGETALYPMEYIEKPWWDEAYISGCPMSCPAVGSMARFHEIRRPVGRLFWAGTETATVWNGSIAGAVQSGYRAAMEVLYEFRPQLLSVDDIIWISPPKLKKQRRKGIIRRLIAWRFIIPIGILAIFVWFRVKYRKNIS